MFPESLIRPTFDDPAYTPLEKAASLFEEHPEEEKTYANPSQFEKRQWHELKTAVEMMAHDVNGYLKEKTGLEKPVIDEYGRISPDAYAGTFNFPQKKIDTDNTYVAEREEEFMWQAASHKAGSAREPVYKAMTEIDKEKIAYYYATTYGVSTTKDMLDMWREERSQGLAEGWEMLSTALFHKAFGDRMIVARASAFDDIANGVDTVIIDKESGDIICAFDELHEVQGAVLSEKRREMKRVAMKQKNNTGGVTLSYGFKKTQAGFTPTSMTHVPVLCLSVETEPLKRILYGFSAEGNLSDEERAFVSDMLEQLLVEAEHADDALVEEGERRRERRNVVIEERKRLQSGYGERNFAKERALLSEEHALTIPIDEAPVTQRVRRTIHILHALLEELHARE